MDPDLRRGFQRTGRTPALIYGSEEGCQSRHAPTGGLCRTFGGDSVSDYVTIGYVWHGQSGGKSGLMGVMFSGLSSLVIEDMTDQDGVIVVRARTAGGLVPCPRCGAGTARFTGIASGRSRTCPRTAARSWCGSGCGVCGARTRLPGPDVPGAGPGRAGLLPAADHAPGGPGRRGGPPVSGSGRGRAADGAGSPGFP